MTSAEEIRSAREQAGLTQEELGAKLGVSMRTVGNWERGSTIPRSKARAIQAVLGEYLATTEGNEPSLSAASDVELLAEIAKRLSRANRQQQESQRKEAPSQDEVGLAAYRPTGLISLEDTPEYE
jgi:transcriptional regulator with XRE-family HTH domain